MTDINRDIYEDDTPEQRKARSKKLKLKVKKICGLYFDAGPSNSLNEGNEGPSEADKVRHESYLKSREGKCPARIGLGDLEWECDKHAGHKSPIHESNSEPAMEDDAWASWSIHWINK